MEDKNRLNSGAERESGFEELTKEREKMSWADHLKKSTQSVETKICGGKDRR